MSRTRLLHSAADSTISVLTTRSPFMRLSLHTLAPLLALSTLAPAAAHADTFLYTFNSGGDSFVFNSPTLLSADTNFATPFCSYEGGACNLTQVNPTSGTIVVGEENGGDGGYDTYVNIPAFDFTPGTYVLPGDKHRTSFTVEAVASFLYTFNSGGDSFVFNSPTLLSADTNFATPFCSYEGGACNLTQVNPTSGTIVVGEENGGDGGYDTYVNIPAFDFTPGTYVLPGDKHRTSFTVEAVRRRRPCSRASLIRAARLRAPWRCRRGPASSAPRLTRTASH